MRDAIDIIAAKNPRYLLQGHEPLTRNFKSGAMLAQLKPSLIWLREQVLNAIRRGEDKGMVEEANLIPPGLLAGQPEAQLPYLLLREHVIDRLYNTADGSGPVSRRGNRLTSPSSGGTLKRCRHQHPEGVSFISNSSAIGTNSPLSMPGSGPYDTTFLFRSGCQ